MKNIIFLLTLLSHYISYKQINDGTITVKLIKSSSQLDKIDGYGVYSEKIEFDGRVYNLLDTGYLSKMIFTCDDLKTMFKKHVKSPINQLNEDNYQIIELPNINRRIFIGDFYTKEQNIDTLFYSLKINCKVLLIYESINSYNCTKGFLNPTISFMGKKMDYLIPEIEERHYPLAVIAEVDSIYGLNKNQMKINLLKKTDTRSVIVKSAW